jgi:hypothetical protein
MQLTILAFGWRKFCLAAWIAMVMLLYYQVAHKEL